MKDSRILLLFLCLCFNISDILAATAYENQDWAYQLNAHLNSINHTKNIWPVKNFSKPFEVAMELYLNQLLSLDGSSQTLKVSAFMKITWVDERFIWDYSSYGDVYATELSTSEIWYPKVYIYNGVGTAQNIKPDGQIILASTTPYITAASFTLKRDLEVSCSLDLTKFPNDKHTCEIQFTALDDVRPTQVTIVNMPNAAKTNYTSLYISSNEWKLLKMTQGPQTVQKKIFTHLDPIGVPLYVVTLTFQRIYDYFIYTLLIPILLLTVLQVLVFVVPIESGEKLSLGITILLSFVIFLLILDNIIPKTETMPLIAHYITASICLSSVTLVMSGIHMILYFTEKDKPMPACMRALMIGFLARAMCIKYPGSRSADCNKGSKVDIVSVDSVQEKSDVNEPQEPEEDDYNPWQVAAMALEKLMFYIGIIIIVVITLAYFLPPFID